MYESLQLLPHFRMLILVCGIATNFHYNTVDKNVVCLLENIYLRNDRTMNSLSLDIQKCKFVSVRAKLMFY